MRVLVLTQYFPPELTAAAARLHAFATALARHGHSVEVVCEVPNHPRGVVEQGYGGRAFDRRSFDGLDVTYVWVSTSSVKTMRSRVAGYGSYALMSMLAGSLVRRADVVLASSPPLPVGLAGYALALRHRAPWVLDVRDLWPAAAVAVGELGEGRLLGVATQLERILYREAAAITTPSQSSRRHIAEIAGDPAKVHLIPSGTTQDWLDLGEEEVDRASLGLWSDEFVWTYAGNLGLAQGLETAVRAAGELGPGFRLVVVGDGPLRRELEELAARVAPDSVLFTGLVPREASGRYLRASDALLVSLASAPGLEYAVPSKLYDCCAIGRPLVVAAAGETRRLVGAHGLGLSVAPGSVAELVGAVRCLREDSAIGTRLVRAARRFAEQNLREHQAGRLVHLLASIERRR